AGIGWDPIVGDKFYKFMLAINWQTSKVIIYHNGTPTSVNITPGASHNLHMVLEQIDSTTVRSRFCVDGEAVGAASYDDTYKLANLTKYGLHGEAQGTPELEKIAEYDDFCLDVDFIAVCGTHCDADTTPDEMDVILAGYVSNGPDGCPDCTIWNDTYRLQKSAACKWEGEFEPTGSSGCKNLWIEAEIAANTLRVTLDHDLASPTNSQAIFEKTVTTPIDCATINDSLTLASSQDPIAECQSAGETPQVITVTMQSV
ncbi:MAG: hypothetical protein GTO62_10845, partial [Planctomycetales bacterium]|nr:hypothetical protein [Planctomycetales bacterium]